jgi:hypothetical protein
MKKAVFFALLLLITETIFGQEFTFRGFEWGTPIQTIVETEGEPEYTDDSLQNRGLPPEKQRFALMYRDKDVASYKATVFFDFSSTGKLISASYLLDFHKSINKSIVDDIFNELLLLLHGIYGDRVPVTEDTRVTAFRGHEYIWYKNGTMIALSNPKNTSLIFIRYKSPYDWQNPFSGL